MIRCHSVFFRWLHSLITRGSFSILPKRNYSQRHEKNFSMQWEKILIGMSIFSHCGENFFSSRWEYFENIVTCIVLSINLIMIDNVLSYACNWLAAKRPVSKKCGFLPKKQFVCHCTGSESPSIGICFWSLLYQ